MANIEHIYRLAALYRGDYPHSISVVQARQLLNRVAWDLKEAGWGLLTDSVRHIANIIDGTTLELITDKGQITALGLLHVEEDPEVASRFEDPTDPDADPQKVDLFPPADVPPDPIPPVTPPPTMPAGAGPSMMAGEQVLPDTLPADIREALAAVEKRVLGLSNMWQDVVREVGIILDRSNDELTAIRGLLDRGFEGKVWVMGIPVSITIRPVPAPDALLSDEDPPPGTPDAPMPEFTVDTKTAT